jgi:hypothetical protein
MKKIKDDEIIEEMQIAIDHINEKNPEALKKIEDMFDIYIQKIFLLTTKFSNKEVDKNKVVNQVTDFLLTMKKQTVGNWCMVECRGEIIVGLEELVEKLGGNPDDVQVG